MKPIETRVRLLPNGYYTAEVKIETKFLFFKYYEWLPCYYSYGSMDDREPRKYGSEAKALEDCAQYCKERRNALELEEKSKKYEIKYYTCV